jgi:tetratricopeptide (TPR) repeat protein
MAEITLSKYCDQAKELIRTDSYDQAIAICRHMLRHYPKYVRAYRLLGEACLEKGDYVEAANLFKRVLGSDMEDMVVYVGLGIIFDEQAAQEEAIWQLERAFEISPGNAEIRKELQRLYAERDGTTPPKLKLTPAALGRLYLREELYQRAIDEFRGVLKEDPQRVDLQVALAAALWWSNQKQEAAQICEEILEEYPNCLKANLVLGEILVSSDREQEGKALLEAAQALDPENLTAQSLFRDHSPLGPETVTVSRLDPEDLVQEVQELEAEAPTFAARTEPSPAHPEMGPEEEMPDWLSKLQREERESEGERVTSPPEEPDMPDWLQQLAEERASEGVEDAEASERGPTVPSEEPADWMSEMSKAAQPPTPEMPPSGETLPSPNEAERIVFEQEPADEASQETPAPAEETPDWLSQLRSQYDSTEEAAPPTEPGEDETPDWLRSLQEEPPESQLAPESEEEVPAWLQDLRTEATKAGIAPDEEEMPASEPADTDEKPEEGPVLEAYDTETMPAPKAGDEPEIAQETMERLRETMPDESDSIEDIMAWMEKSKALLAEEGVEDKITPEGSAQPSQEEEVPTWLRELRPSTAAPAEAPPGDELEEPSEEGAVPTPEEEIPTWLRDLRPDAADEGEPAVEVESAPPPREEPVAHEEESTVPLEQPEGAAEEEQIPSWLLQLRADEATEEEEALAAHEPEATLEVTPTPSGEELPTWLRELREEASIEQEPTLTEEPEPAMEETPPPREETPSWLRQLQEEAMAEEGASPSQEQETSAEELAAPPEDDMPSWLRQLRDEAVAADEFLLPEDPTAAPSTGEDAPSWLLELRAQTAPDLGRPGPGEEETGPEELPAPPSEEEEMPSWLHGLRTEVDREQPSALSDEPEVPFDETPPHEVEAELPTWLQELRAEIEQESPPAAPGEAEPHLRAEPGTPAKLQEPPAWLREPQAEAEDTTEEELKVPEEELPSRPQELEDVPSWLRELRAQAEEGETGVLAEKAQAAADEVPLPPLEEEELPSWLRELRAEATVEDSMTPPSSEEATPSEEVATQEPVEPSGEEEETLAEGYDAPALPEEETVLPEAPLDELEAPFEVQDQAPPLEREPIPAEEVAREEEALAVQPHEEPPLPEGSPEKYLEILEADPRDHSSRLALARAYSQSGDLDQAVEQYQSMLSLGAMVGEVKADLESAVESAPDYLPAQELLADAYMKTGDLQRALEKYRWLRAMMAR